MDQPSSKTYDLAKDLLPRLGRELNRFRLNSQFCDVRLVVAGPSRDVRSQSGEVESKDDMVASSVQAHRLVLSAASPVFEAMFSNPDFEESKQPDVALHDVEHSILATLVQFVYTGTVTIDVANVQALFCTSKLYQLDRLTELCTEFMVERLAVHNCLGVYQLARLNLCHQLQDAALRVIKQEFEQVSRSQELLELSFDELEQLIDDEELHVDSEETIYLTLTRWLEHNLDQRRQHLEHLFKKVRLTSLSRNFFVENVLESDLLDGSPECRNLIRQAAKIHLTNSNLANTRTRSGDSESYILVVGGSNQTNDCELYDPEAKCWRKAKATNVKRVFHGVVCLDNRVYAIGGESALSSVECFDPQTNVWTAVADMTQVRTSFGSCALNGRMYAVGGAEYLFSVLSDVESYVPVLDRWLPGPSMTTQRSGLSCVSCNDTLFAIGGYDGRNILSSVERLDSREGRWTQVAPMSTARSSNAALSFNNKVYVTGGLDGSNKLSNCEVFDPRANRWQPIAPMSAPRYGHSIVELGGRLHVLGGWQHTLSSNGLNTVEVYDPLTNQWTPGEPMNQKRHNFGAASIKCSLSQFRNIISLQ